MSPQSQSSPSAGFSGMVVSMVAIFFLILGLLVGAIGLLAVLKTNDGTAERLGIVASAPPAPATPAVAPAPVAEPESAYALVYPIEETLRIEGAIAPPSVRAKVTAERFAMQKCYQTELDRNPATKGEVSLQFTVSNSTGKVMASVVRQNTTGNEALTGCVLTLVNAWTFPLIAGSELSVVRFDVLFLPVSNSGSM